MPPSDCAWQAAISAMRPRSYDAVDAAEHADQCAVAASFVWRHAERAEAHGWRPEHVTHEHGLAARWSPIGFVPRLIAWEQRLMLFDCLGLPVVLHARADGSVGLVRGRLYTAVRGRHLAFLDAVAA